MRKYIKNIIICLLFVVVLGFPYKSYADTEGVVVKYIPLEDNTSLIITLKYDEDSLATFLLNKDNNYTEASEIKTNNMEIKEFTMTTPEGDVTFNYKLTGELKDNTYIINTVKIGDSTPVKENDNQHNYDGSSNQHSDNTSNEVGSFTVKALVPENFYSDIKLFFLDEYQNNISYILRYPEYKVDGVQRVGLLELNNIEIESNIGQFRIDAEGELYVSKDKNEEYLVKIENQELKSIDKNISENVEEIEDKKADTIHEDVENINKDKSKGILSKFIITFIIGVILIIAYVYIKIRER